MSTRIWIRTAIGFVIFAGLLFGSAGTLAWPAGWAYLAILFGASLWLTFWLARRDPALLEERMKPLFQKDQPFWDRIVLAVLHSLMLGWLVLVGLDAVRFRWSVMPVWLEAIGGVGFVFFFWLCYRVCRENTYLATVVRIQTERDHKVVSTGPYAVVRHPLYAAALLLFFSSALLLGSWYGLAGSLLIGASIVVRTALEDRELQRGLHGYKDYAARVRYRLIPLVW